MNDRPEQDALNQTALENQSAEMRTLLDAIPAGVFIAHDRDCVNITGNRSAYALFGIDQAKHPNLSFRQPGNALVTIAFNGRELAPHEIPMQRAAATGKEVRNAELDVVTQGGRRLKLLGSALPVFDAQNQVCGCVAVFRDITEHKRSEEELRKRDALLRDALSAAQMVAWEWDLNTNIVTFSENAQQLYGAASGDARALSEFIIPEDRPILTEAVDRCIAGGGPYYAEFRVCTPSGRVRWVADRGSVQLGTDGKPRRLSGIAVEITDRKLAQEALKQREAEVLEAIRHKDEFLAMLAHELRNPLAPIRNGLYILQQPNATPQQLQKTREMMTRQVAHLTRLVDDLLDVARVSRRRILLRKARVNLSELLKTLADDSQNDFAKVGTKLLLELPQDALWVMGDATRLNQIVGNLLHNAFKFTKAGDTVRLSAHADSAATMAVITVMDTGAGIDPEVLPRMYEPFIQSRQGADRSQGGLGLGLALVKGLVELHGGAVSASSKGPGCGSTFCITIPLSKADEAMINNIPVPFEGSARRILVIEDNADSAETMKVLLEMGGHSVELAYSGQDGIDKARASNPEVVICDIGLPGGLDGYDVARALRGLNRATLIALTGYGQTDDKRRAAEAGFHTHLTKPVDPALLEDLINKLPMLS